MKLLFAMFLIVASSSSLASDVCDGCTIESLGFGPHYDSLCSSTSCVFVKMKETITSKPCDGGGWDFTINTSTESGKTTLSGLLSAYAMGNKIFIKGTGFCSNSSITEDLLYMGFSNK